MSKRILCVDDEINVLQALERQYRKRFEIHTALGPEAGLRALSSEGPFAVLVSDLRMPGMNGIEFLTRAREASPDTVRIMLTGQADLTATIAAVNQGHVFQFLTKPCPPEMLARALDSALEQHRLVTAERELLEQTLRSTVRVLSEILSLVNPTAFSRANRIRRYVMHMATKLNLANQWEYEIAAMLSQIGCVTVPQDLLDKVYAAQPLTNKEQEILASQARLGHDLLAQIPRLGDVAKMVAQQATAPPNGNGQMDRIASGALLLKTALDFDEKMVRGGTFITVLSAMRDRKGYPLAFLEALEEVQIVEAQSEVRRLKVLQLRPRMIAHADIRAKNSLLLLAKGQEITESALARLQGFAVTVGIFEPVSVIVPMPSGGQAAPAADSAAGKAS